MNPDLAAPVWAPRVLSVVRIVIGLILLQHPTAKFFGIPHVASFDTLPMSSIYMIAGVIELVGAIPFLLGFYTRSAAFLLSGHLAFVYFVGHAPNGFYPLLNRGEIAVVLCFIFLYYAFAGGGPWSLDAALRQRAAQTQPNVADHLRS